MAQLPPHLAELRQKAQTTHMQGDTATARPLYESYLGSVPQDHGMWSNLGALLRREGHYDMALRAQRRAYELAPGDTNIRNNYANILADTGHPAQALELRMALLDETPDDPQMMAMIGKALRSMGRSDEGVALLTKAVEKHPDHSELGIQLALSQLDAGDYANGFVTFERRWETDELKPRQMTKPQWDGGDLSGKRIMVLPEQGFGDCLAMARFLPVLQQFNPAKVLLATERPLQRLFDGLPGADWTGGALPEGEDFDVWTNIMDLPKLHFAISDKVPKPPALTVPEDSKKRAKSLLAPHRSKFTVGVVWTGSLTYRGNAFRSFEHSQFHPLIDIPGVQLISLYKGPKLDAFRADATSAHILDAGSSEQDFGDTAAMMQELDLVITSDTATAHLAGTLGVPVWTLLHWDAFWMWRHEGDETPWYPSMRLIRQTTPRDWDEVFTRVAADLTAEVANSTP